MNAGSEKTAKNAATASHRRSSRCAAASGRAMSRPTIDPK
jgi:hypothetical protein